MSATASIPFRTANAYPHEGGCAECAHHKKCNVCGQRITPSSRCTNGRCAKCHAKVCTPGGITSDGHGFGSINPSTKHYQR